MVSQAATASRVAEIFTDWLRQNRQRNTPERMAILQAIYARDDHFDAETLHSDLQKDHLDVSRATVYNTLELLQSCNLIRKHQFDSTQTQYEKSYGSKQHDHLICIDCKRVLEFCDPRMQQIQSTMGKLLNFEVQHHSLTMYGDCLTPKCEFNPSNN